MNHLNRVYFTTAEVRRLLKCSKAELEHVLRPSRDLRHKGQPLYRLEKKSQFMGRIFTMEDIMKLGKYFKALREFKTAQEELRLSHQETV